MSLNKTNYEIGRKILHRSRHIKLRFERNKDQKHLELLNIKEAPITDLYNMAAFERLLYERKIKKTHPLGLNPLAFYVNEIDFIDSPVDFIKDKIIGLVYSVLHGLKRIRPNQKTKICSKKYRGIIKLIVELENTNDYNKKAQSSLASIKLEKH